MENEMKNSYTYTDERKQKVSFTKTNDKYLIQFNYGADRVQIPKSVLTYILLNLEKELVNEGNTTTA